VTLIGAEPMLPSTAAAMTVRRRTFQPAAEFIEYLRMYALSNAADIQLVGRQRPPLGASGHRLDVRRYLLSAVKRTSMPK
jgi:hypothetical protein